MTREEVMEMGVWLGMKLTSTGYPNVPKGTKGQVTKITGFVFRMIDQEKWPIEVEWENRVIGTYPPNNEEGLFYILDKVGVRTSNIKR